MHGCKLPNVVWDKTKTALRSGEYVTGHFAPAGSDLDTPGVLRWSAESGANLDLIGDTSRWPAQFGDERYAIHGLLSDGDQITLLDAMVRTTSFDRQLRRMSSSTLALGAHIELGHRWTRAIYSTANLSEWRADTGIKPSRPAPRRRPHDLRVDWRPPTREEVRIAGAQLAFAGQSSATIAYAPRWTIDTWQVVAVNADRALTVDDYYRRYAEPLVAFMVFVSDRPDTLSSEILVDTPRQIQVEIWRQGPTVESRSWSPSDGYLFHADAVRDFPRAIRAWWRLHKRVWPALGLFASHVNDGNSYSPARFLTVYTAIEGYAKMRHGHKKLSRLREYAGVPTELHGCSNDALALIGASRNYLAHLGDTGGKYSVADIQDGAFVSTRRVSALMQACLLRDLGFRIKERGQILANYYRDWPIP